MDQRSPAGYYVMSRMNDEEMESRLGKRTAHEQFAEPWSIQDVGAQIAYRHMRAMERIATALENRPLSAAQKEYDQRRDLNLAYQQGKEAASTDVPYSSAPYAPLPVNEHYNNAWRIGWITWADENEPSGPNTKAAKERGKN
jgi:hypothetical protein